MGRGGSSSGSHSSGGGHFNYNSSSSSSNHTHVYHHHYNSYGYGVHRDDGVGIGFAIVMFSLFICVLVFYLLTHGSTVTRSTIERHKLSSTECKVSSDWYEDDVSWIYDELELLKGMRLFYEETGVQPYLIVTDNIDGVGKPTESQFRDFLEKRYSELFDDYGHIIVCFLESSPNVYATYCWVGQDAMKVIDSEAREVLLDYFDAYYSRDLSDEEYFSLVFRDASNRIMSVTPNIGLYVLAGVVIVIVVSVISFAAYWCVKKKKEQAAIDLEILKTSLKEEE